jgi:hypothetical protein
VDFGGSGGTGGGLKPYSYGGAGGGAIRLTVAGTLSLMGQISANGRNGSGQGSGGGAGGSLWLTVGNLAGTVSASLGVGVTNQILEPWLGAVLGKILVLVAIILFLQWRPNGLFVTKSRSLDG